MRLVRRVRARRARISNILLSDDHHLDLFSELYHSNHKNITCIIHLVRTRNPTLECSLEYYEDLNRASRSNTGTDCPTDGDEACTSCDDGYHAQGLQCFRGGIVGGAINCVTFNSNPGYYGALGGCADGSSHVYPIPNGQRFYSITDADGLDWCGDGSYNSRVPSSEREYTEATVKGRIARYVACIGYKGFGAVHDGHPGNYGSSGWQTNYEFVIPGPRISGRDNNWRMVMVLPTGHRVITCREYGWGCGYWGTDFGPYCRSPYGTNVMSQFSGVNSVGALANRARELYPSIKYFTYAVDFVEINACESGYIVLYDNNWRFYEVEQ